MAAPDASSIFSGPSSPAESIGAGPADEERGLPAWPPPEVAGDEAAVLLRVVECQHALLQAQRARVEAAERRARSLQAENAVLWHALETRPSDRAPSDCRREDLVHLELWLQCRLRPAPRRCHEAL